MARRRSRSQSRDAVFADSVFWIALTRRQDQHRPRAVRWETWLEKQGKRVVTTEAVLWEWLNSLADPETRQRAADGYRYCHEGQHVELIPFDREQIEGAFALYDTRPDKGWSLTDCLSFVVMQARGLTQALTADHHFEQAGFRALLLQDPPP